MRQEIQSVMESTYQMKTSLLDLQAKNIKAVLNGVKTPLWKVPVFVKDGSIIPMTNPNNNPKEIQRDQRSFLIYPNGTTF